MYIILCMFFNLSNKILTNITFMGIYNTKLYLIIVSAIFTIQDNVLKKIYLKIKKTSLYTRFCISNLSIIL